MGLQPAAKVVKTTQTVPRAVNGGCALMKVIQTVKVTSGSKSSRKLLTKKTNSQRPITTETVNVMKDEKATNAMEAVSTLEMQPLMGMECRQCGWRQALQLQRVQGGSASVYFFDSVHCHQCVGFPFSWNIVRLEVDGLASLCEKER